MVHWIVNLIILGFFLNISLWGVVFLVRTLKKIQHISSKNIEKNARFAENVWAGIISGAMLLCGQIIYGAVQSVNWSLNFSSLSNFLVDISITLLMLVFVAIIFLNVFTWLFYSGLSKD
ncbi:hypothetical protein K9M74_04250 [Candidatus Woesearchaeota archaeon]|nr:hypothetical protein [Candidatus Woesearchaeota archaeon]